jgi:hypothetical protein
MNNRDESKASRLSPSLSSTSSFPLLFKAIQTVLLLQLALPFFFSFFLIVAT